VLEDLRLVMDAIPRHVEQLRQEKLEQAMAAQHLGRQPLTGRGELNTAVRGMVDQAQLGELLDHARRRRRSHAKPVGEPVHRHRRALTGLKRIVALA